ncbi:MAG: hypothetical protein ACTSRA_21145, partial [Promethearchaeota archaeon]
MDPRRKKLLIMVSHTHWDREWYLTFNQFRLRLLNLIDETLELSKNSRWNSFMLDGQTAILEDYLEIRPQRKDELENAISSGKIVVGPWYVLADEFLESAEGVIRNLLIGHEISSRFGSTMKVGYVPDTFGHIWQLPQILKGFGIHYCYLFRGYPPLFGGHDEYKNFNDDTPLEFYWRAPDGSKVLTLHHITGYGNAAGLSIDLNNEFGFLPAVLKISSAIESLKERTSTDIFLLMNGSDHLFP